MSKTEIKNNFLLNYGWSPSRDEKEHFERFCDGIATQEMLEKVLDPQNHPAFESGRRIRPNIATLYAIKDSTIRADFYPGPPTQAEEFSYEKPNCLMCIEGEVWDFVWREKWVTEYIGSCKFCSNGDAEVSPEMLQIIQSRNIPLPDILLEFTIRLLENKLETGLQISQDFTVTMKHLANSPALGR